MSIRCKQITHDSLSCMGLKIYLYKSTYRHLMNQHYAMRNRPHEAGINIPNSFPSHTDETQACPSRHPKTVSAFVQSKKLEFLFHDLLTSFTSGYAFMHNSSLSMSTTVFGATMKKGSWPFHAPSFAVSPSKHARAEACRETHPHRSRVRSAKSSEERPAAVSWEVP